MASHPCVSAPRSWIITHPNLRVDTLIRRDTLSAQYATQTRLILEIRIVQDSNTASDSSGDSIQGFSVFGFGRIVYSAARYLGTTLAGLPIRFRSAAEAHATRRSGAAKLIFSALVVIWYRLSSIDCGRWEILGRWRTSPGRSPFSAGWNGMDELEPNHEEFHRVICLDKPHHGVMAG
ncbi:hypothetical protein AAWM_00897 [Aspergillus awamori]|uniref:Uncharacterized protein n=1 Tax=Aspergillus awamori TaxID=105351 RepID=A0A401KFN3_ASPAW|nr:hypothetical protein AAWM_00897 [Aspergillus awamori]